jgi:hypothetical protein
MEEVEEIRLRANALVELILEVVPVAHRRLLKLNRSNGSAGPARRSLG